VVTLNRTTGAQAPQSSSSRGAEPPKNQQSYAQVRDKVQRRLVAELSPTVSADNPEVVRRTLERIFNDTLLEEGLPLSRTERNELFEKIVADVLGYGPIEPLLNDDTVTEVLVNGPDQVYIERDGILQETDIRFRSSAEVLRIIDRIVSPLGRRVDESSPMVDARLPDGSRVNVIIPPLSLVGPCISIRKFAKTALTVDDLMKAGTFTKEMADLFKACTQARLNMIISGGTSTGKTTLLNALSSFLPAIDRIVTIEDAAELRLHQAHVVRLEARPPNVEGRGEITIRQLVINALRMRPDRIIVGEVRGGEALDMLQAMNTGHDGSLTTAHSNSPRDTLHRIETMTLMAGMDLPLRAVREQIASAFDLVIHLDRLADGTRRVVQVSEVQGMEGDIIVMQDIMRFVQTGVQDRRIQGYFSATGVRPKFMDKMEAMGIFVSPTTFTPAARRAGR
jgi:pilus assembly protein CpaF